MYNSISRVREQVNGVTSFIDASTVYGSEILRLRDLRAPGTPFLRVEFGDLLPDMNATHALAGDLRASEVPLLAALHTLFVREHNRVAK